MPGTILVLDGMPTSRMMLKVQLSAGYYHVVQGERLADAPGIIARTRPDLIVASADLPDGDIAATCAARDRLAPGLPLMILTAQNDRRARRQALRCGADEVMSHPVHDLELQARIRRMVRQYSLAEDLRPRDGSSRALGLAEAPAAFAVPGSVALVCADARRSTLLRNHLARQSRHRFATFTPDRLLSEVGHGVSFDAILLAPTGEADLRLLADLRSRAATRHCAVLVVTDATEPARIAEALDLGADDVLCPEADMGEALLRLDKQLLVKRHADRLRNTLQQGLRAAVRDPLTGLFNRRFARPFLANCARQGQPFAVMLVDIDHFKSVNDRFGHPVGDRVIAETAGRLCRRLRPQDMLARVGGEEFLVVMRNLHRAGAEAAAQGLRACVGATPLLLAQGGQAVSVTVSIGLVTIPPRAAEMAEGMADEAAVDSLICAADRALYAAKNMGRDTVSAAVAPAA